MQTLIVNISNQNELSILTSFLKEKGFDYKILPDKQNELSYIEALELFSKPIETKEKLQKKTIVNLVKQANKDKKARKKA